MEAISIQALQGIVSFRSKPHLDWRTDRSGYIHTMYMLALSGPAQHWFLPISLKLICQNLYKASCRQALCSAQGLLRSLVSETLICCASCCIKATTLPRHDGFLYIYIICCCCSTVLHTMILILAGSQSCIDQAGSPVCWTAGSTLRMRRFARSPHSCRSQRRAKST